MCELTGHTYQLLTLYSVQLFKEPLWLTSVDIFVWIIKYAPQINVSIQNVQSDVDQKHYIIGVKER